MNQTRKVLKGRYLLFAAPAGIRGKADAIDLVSGQRCLAIWEPHGSDTADALQTERVWFDSLSDNAQMPQVMGWFDEPSDESALLILSRCAGTFLRNVIVFDGVVRPISGQTAKRWALSLIATLRRLTPQLVGIPQLAVEHLVVTPENTVALHRLVPLATTASADAIQARQLGQLLYLWTTGFPYQEGNPWEARTVRSVSPMISPALEQTIHQLVMGELPTIDLATLESTMRDLEPECDPAALLTPDSSTTSLRPDWYNLALQAGNHLAATIEREAKEAWLYNGLAGSVLLLAEYVATFGNEAWRAPLRHAAQRLLPPLTVVPHPGGLYLGEAGVAFALIKAGEVLEDAELTAGGWNLAQHVTTLPHANADLLWGAAGRLRFLLWAWKRTEDDLYLVAAQSTVAWLFETAKEDCFWISVIATEPGPYLGYGHGIAGIGDALLDFYEATGDCAVWEMIERIAAVLRHSAVPTFQGTCFNWSQTTADTVYLEQWCHGATGIGFFLIRLLQTGRLPKIKPYAEGAVRTIAYGGGYLSPCVCHGVAGSLDLLLDYDASIGEHPLQHHIERQWRLLDDFRVTHPTGIAWRNHHLKGDDPSLMTGYGGVMALLLRLLQPERPRFLSLAAMQHSSLPLTLSVA